MHSLKLEIHFKMCLTVKRKYIYLNNVTLWFFVIELENYSEKTSIPFQYHCEIGELSLFPNNHLSKESILRCKKQL